MFFLYYNQSLIIAILVIYFKQMVEKNLQLSLHLVYKLFYKFLLFILLVEVLCYYILKLDKLNKKLQAKYIIY